MMDFFESFLELRCMEVWPHHIYPTKMQIIQVVSGPTEQIAQVSE